VSRYRCIRPANSAHSKGESLMIRDPASVASLMTILLCPAVWVFASLEDFYFATLFGHAQPPLRLVSRSATLITHSVDKIVFRQPQCIDNKRLTRRRNHFEKSDQGSDTRINTRWDLKSNLSIGYGGSLIERRGRAPRPQPPTTSGNGARPGQSVYGISLMGPSLMGNF